MKVVSIFFLEKRAIIRQNSGFEHAAGDAAEHLRDVKLDGSVVVEAVEQREIKAGRGLAVALI